MVFNAKVSSCSPEVTRDMTLHYINDPRTIVLAVLPANQDMSVSDALQLARQVDPQGSRILVEDDLGVLDVDDVVNVRDHRMRIWKDKD